MLNLVPAKRRVFHVRVIFITVASSPIAWAKYLRVGCAKTRNRLRLPSSGKLNNPAVGKQVLDQNFKKMLLPALNYFISKPLYLIKCSHLNLERLKLTNCSLFGSKNYEIEQALLNMEYEYQLLKQSAVQI